MIIIRLLIIIAIIIILINIRAGCIIGGEEPNRNCKDGMTPSQISMHLLRGTTKNPVMHIGILAIVSMSRANTKKLTIIMKKGLTGYLIQRTLPNYINTGGIARVNCISTAKQINYIRKQSGMTQIIIQHIGRGDIT